MEESATGITYQATLSGVEKTAILFKYLGSEEIKPLLQYLEREEVEEISRAMKNIDMIDQDMIDLVLSDFCKQTNSVLGSDEDQSKSILLEYDEIHLAASPEAQKKNELKNIYALEDQPTEKVTELLSEESAQVWAIILSQLSSLKAKEIMDALDKDKRQDILCRISKLKAVNQKVLEQINQLLEKEDSDDEEQQQAVSEYNGAKVGANILSLFTENDATDLLSSIKEKDDALFQDLSKYYMSFSDLLELNQETLQAILSTYDPQKLALAIAKSTDDVVKKCFSVITKRSATLIEEEIKSLSKSPDAAVQKAQQEIVTYARKLENENKITLSNEEQESE